VSKSIEREDRKSVSFSLTITKYELLKLQSATRGMTSSQLTRMLVHDYMNRSPSKGVVARLEAKLIELDHVIAKYTSLCDSLGVPPSEAQHLGAQGDIKETQ